MNGKLIDKIDSPENLKKIPFRLLPQLCQEIREILIETTSKTGGHLASNLGTVELTVALHRVFDSPQDQIVWDVGHQCYTHKLLTGRREEFHTLRQENGLSGFPKRNESIHDAFIAGHSSTSISAAYGLARAKKLHGDPHHVIAVIGDGSFTSGLAYEGANNAARWGDNLIVILNDNKMSISKNVGALSKYLSKIRSRPAYFRTKDTIGEVCNKIPVVGKGVYNTLNRTKVAVKDLVYGSNWFEDLGFYYLGPVDGHDLESLCSVLQRAKDIHRPVFLHVETQKGKGYSFAEDNPGEYHGTSGFDITTGLSRKNGETNFSNEFGKYLTELAHQDERVCAITAAMKYGTGLNYFYRDFKKSGRFYDVGIAEPHAVTFAGGLAANGEIPVFAVYSSFLQRCYDEVLHDISIEKQHVILAVDRAGIVGEDGETHQGLFDVAMLSSIPDITIYSPATYEEMKEALNQTIYHESGVCCVRYPRGGEIQLDVKEYPPNRDYVYCPGNKQSRKSEIILVSYGRIFGETQKAAALLAEKGIAVGLIKLNRILPFPDEALELMMTAKAVLFVEEGIKAGGLAQMAGSILLENGFPGKYKIQAIDNVFIPQASVASAIKKFGLDGESIAKRVEDMLR